MYKRIIRPVLFLIDPEKIHNIFIWFGKILGSCPLSRFFLNLVYGYHGSNISKTVDGIYYKTPVLLSAGFDYNGNLTKVLPSISFGGVEVGSVTAFPCAGNPKPRLTRLTFSKSILVNKGLKNDGVEVVLSRLQKKKKFKSFVIGLSIARTNEAEASTVEAGIADYVFSLKKAVEVKELDYYTINISCPNTFGGEPFTTPELLERLFTELDKISRNKPLYAKMPISVSNNVFVQLLGILNRHNVQGVIIGNLQKDYSFIDERDFRPQKYSGGLSGKPCAERANELITLTKTEYKNRFTIIGCGGIFSSVDAQEKFKLGADLIQLITGMIYEGPDLINKICQGVAKSQSSSVGRAPLS